MSDIIDQNFRDLISLFTQHGAEFLVVGAHSLAAHDVPRSTGDIDFWVRPTPENATRVWRALCAFGAPLGDAQESDFASPRFGLHIGVPPGRIDVLTTIAGVEFETAWQRKLPATVVEMPVFVMGLEDLLANKRSAGREKDLKDVERLIKRHGDSASA